MFPLFQGQRVARRVQAPGQGAGDSGRDECVDSPFESFAQIAWLRVAQSQRTRGSADSGACLPVCLCARPSARSR